MTSNPATCSPSTGLEEVAKMMVDCDCGAIPVVDSSRPVGIVTDRDITTRVIAKGQNPLQKRASDAMTESTVTIAQDENVDRLAQMMEEKQIRRVVVTDQNDQCVGIVAQADLARQNADRRTGEVVEQVSQPSRSASQASRG